MCQWLGVMTMSDVRWIKIYTNMFDNRKIKQIEKLPEGNALLVIWLKLLTLAGNVNDSGFVYFTKDIPYTDQMLSTEFNMPLSTIQLALNVFKQYEMIDITDDLLKISNWEKYQNVEGMEKIREQNRIRKQNQRLREKEAKQIECHVTCHDEVTQSHATDIDIEKDIKNKNIDIRDKSIEKDSTNKAKRFIKPTIEEVQNYILENNLNVNSTYWYDYYESNGWKVGRNPMKDWKACVRRWNKTEMNNHIKENREKVTSNPFLEILMEEKGDE